MIRKSRPHLVIRNLRPLHMFFDYSPFLMVAHVSSGLDFSLRRYEKVLKVMIFGLDMKKGSTVFRLFGDDVIFI